MNKKIYGILAAVLCVAILLGINFLVENRKTDPAPTGPDELEGFVLCQQWRAITNGTYLTFKEDGACEYGDTSCRYVFDREKKTVTIQSSVDISFNIYSEDNIFKLSLLDIVYVPAELYQQYHDKLINDQNNSLVTNKVELVAGNTYTTKSGLTFTFTKAELAQKDTKYKFRLLFTCDQEISLTDVEYVSPRGTAGFDMKVEAQNDNETQFLGVLGLNEEDIATDQEQYGVLSFTIGETLYYLSINAFIP